MNTIADLKRVAHVIRVLHKYRLGAVIRKAGLAWALPFTKRFRKEDLPEDLPKRVRQAMEELGGTYVKLGQLLSIRPDLIPHEYCEEFTQLQDNIKPDPEIPNTIPNRKIFSHIDKHPLGSASIAQVHKARLKTKKAVVVKIRRPNIKKQMQTDIDILRFLANKIQPDGINPIQIINEFERYTHDELDFLHEARNIDLIRNTAKNNKNITVPEVYWQYSTSESLVMEYLEGTKLSELQEGPFRKIAKQLIEALMEQIFITGAFHADLHPGNVLLLKNGKLGLIDFGIVGRVDKNTQKTGLKLYSAIILNEPEKASELLLEYGTPTIKTNRTKFKHEVAQLVRDWNEKHTHITRLMHDLFICCINNDIKISNDVVLLGKALVTAEGTAKKLDPSFNFVKNVQPIITKLLKKSYTPAKIIEKLRKQATQSSEAILKIPQQTSGLLTHLKKGRFEIGLTDAHFRHLGKDINTSSNRLSYALVSASCIMAGSLLVKTGPTLGAYSILSILSYSIATIFVIALVSSILREGGSQDIHPKDE